MIVFENVTKKYGDSEPVLNKINFSIDKGAFVYLVGPTGSGKTTIFRIIIHDVLPTEGQVNVAELDLISLPKSKVSHLRRRVGVVFQDLKLLMDRTVTENVMLPLELSGTVSKDAKIKAEEILSEVGLGDKFTQFPLQLSGGERQRVAIARALVFDPEVILADEPTGNLDNKTSFQILDLLRNINRRGTTIFMATHNDRIIDSGDRVIVIENGNLIEDKKGKAKKDSDSSSKEEKKEVQTKKDQPKADGPEAPKGEKISLENLADKK